MRTIQCQSHPEQHGASSSLHSLRSSSGTITMSPLSSSSISLAALLILTLPICKSAPAEVTIGQSQPQSQIDAVCSSYLSADHKFQASDVLGELCVMMLVQRSKELKGQEKSKRAELQGPGGIQSRGYFLYRPRNGRRSLEYE
ncbi:neuromedin-U [Solea solea]|uniref:neuromedin-U n=1 Tax=Solea solea TaxID=90069 RepID=UPI00272B8C85|nr:neuromedin-U [Solea solea]XP_058494923.1 neuromedin-U [Solea solea]